MIEVGNTRFSYGAVLVFAVFLFLLIAGAMFFADEVDDFFDHRELKTTQVMELHGDWLGMKLASLDSPTGRHLGFPPSLPGVMIVEIAEKNGWRARQAGALEGDVIVGVDGKSIRDLADVYDVSRNLDVGSSVLLDIRRWGQPMTLVLPALSVPASVAGQPRPGQVTPPAPGVALGTMIGPVQQAAWTQGVQGANAVWSQPVALAPGSQGSHFFCPIHNQTWTQNAVYPNYRCPLGNCPLTMAR